jgi:hypothetical protein
VASGHEHQLATGSAVGTMTFQSLRGGHAKRASLAAALLASERTRHRGVLAGHTPRPADAGPHAGQAPKTQAPNAQAAEVRAAKERRA